MNASIDGNRENDKSFKASSVNASSVNSVHPLDRQGRFHEETLDF